MGGYVIKNSDYYCSWKNIEVENKIPDCSDLLKKTDYDAKI